MHHDTTTNTTEYPDCVWEPFKELVPDDKKLSSGLRATVAQHVLDEHPDLSESQRQQIENWTFDTDDG
jgi:hypothetical protein